MAKKEILLLLTDKWSDWETGYATATLNTRFNYEIKTVALDNTSKISMGGMKPEIDYTFESYHNYDNLAMVIIPGGMAWKDSSHSEIAEFIRKLSEMKIPIAAICDATRFLGRHGFLNEVKHTGNALEMLHGMEEFNGDCNYIKAQAVSDGGFITANGTAAVEFAYEIFKLLNVMPDVALSMWFNNYKHGLVR